MGDEPVTLYAVFTQNITVTYYDNSTTAKSTASPRYYNNGNSTSASFKLAQSSKSGWTVRGWSTKTTGNGSIAYNNNTSFTRTSNCTLYGMYQKTCTLTAISYNSTQTATGTAYYNSNGKTVNATATVPTGASYSGWSWRGWGANGTKTANASVSYANGATYTLGTGDATIYGLYSVGVTATFYSGSNKGNTQTASGTRYYNAAGNTANASVTVPNGASLSGWTWRGWSANGKTAGNASVSYANGATISGLTGDITCYGLYSQEITCSFVSNGTQTAKGTRYYNSSNNTVNASVTVPSGAAISGWTWRGWSAAATTTGNASVTYANGATISGLTQGYTYYGLYQQTITVTYYNNSTSASSTSGTRYYNAAGNYTNPSFTLTQTNSSGWTCRGWSTTNKGNAGITYSNGATFTRDSNVTLYGLYQQTVYLYTVLNGSTTTNSGTKYWAPAGYINPTFTVANPSVSDGTFNGWSTSSSSTTVSYTSISGTAFTSNTTLYAVIKYNDITLRKDLPFVIYTQADYNLNYGTHIFDASKYASVTISGYSFWRVCAEAETAGLYLNDTKLFEASCTDEDGWTDHYNLGHNNTFAIPVSSGTVTLTIKWKNPYTYYVGGLEPGGTITVNGKTKVG